MAGRLLFAIALWGLTLGALAAYVQTRTADRYTGTRAEIAREERVVLCEALQRADMIETCDNIGKD